MISGQTDPERLARLARGKLKVKHHQLVEALTGRFNDHHRFLAPRVGWGWAFGAAFSAQPRAIPGDG
jgi:hypothetical protein